MTLHRCSVVLTARLWLASFPSQLKSQLGEMDLSLVARQQDLESVHEEKNSLESRLNEVKLKVQNLEVELREARKEEESGRNQLVQLEHTLRAESASLREENEALRSGKEQVAGDLRELESLQEQCEVVRGERDAVKRAAEEQATAHKEESKKLKAFIVKMKRELSETKERVRGCVCVCGGGGWRCVCMYVCGRGECVFVQVFIACFTLRRPP